jgi:hypothetical protein
VALLRLVALLKQKAKRCYAPATARRWQDSKTMARAEQKKPPTQSLPQPQNIHDDDDEDDDDDAGPGGTNEQTVGSGNPRQEITSDDNILNFDHRRRQASTPGSHPPPFSHMWNFCLFYLDLTGVYPTEDLLERFGHVLGRRRSRRVLRLPMQQT